MSILVDEEEPLVDVEDPPFEPRDVKVRCEKWVEAEFDIYDFLGRGKFGEVKRCVEKQTGKEFAAKFICAPRPQDKKEVEQEVEIMKKLQHKRLLQLYDCFCSKTEMCLVLEIILGGELFDRVIDEDFILTERACVVFMRQICEGVEYMHSKNIIHLDMKPENILCLTRSGNRIKIIDFGLAREYNAKKELRVLFGTPEFMAPEVVQYEPIKFATDMWSVGVICYVLLSGLSPFMGDNDSETLVNVIKGEYDFNYAEFSDVTEPAKDLIRKLLVMDKTKRLTATDCLQHPWLRREEPKPSASQLELSKKRLKRFVYRRKWQKIVNAIIALKRMGVCLKDLRNRERLSGHLKQESIFGWDAKKGAPPNVKNGPKVPEVQDSDVSTEATIVLTIDDADDDDGGRVSDDDAEKTYAGLNAQEREGSSHDDGQQAFVSAEITLSVLSEEEEEASDDKQTDNAKDSQERGSGLSVDVKHNMPTTRGKNVDKRKDKETNKNMDKERSRSRENVETERFWKGVRNDTTKEVESEQVKFRTEKNQTARCKSPGGGKDIDRHKDGLKKTEEERGKSTENTKDSAKEKTKTEQMNRDKQQPTTTKTNNPKEREPDLPRKNGSSEAPWSRRGRPEPGVLRHVPKEERFGSRPKRQEAPPWSKRRIRKQDEVHLHTLKDWREVQQNKASTLTRAPSHDIPIDSKISTIEVLNVDSPERDDVEAKTRSRSGSRSREGTGSGGGERPKRLSREEKRLSGSDAPEAPVNMRVVRKSKQIEIENGRPKSQNLENIDVLSEEKSPHNVVKGTTIMEENTTSTSNIPQIKGSRPTSTMENVKAPVQRTALPLHLHSSIDLKRDLKQSKTETSYGAKKSLPCSKKDIHVKDLPDRQGEKSVGKDEETKIDERKQKPIKNTEVVPSIKCKTPVIDNVDPGKGTAEHKAIEITGTKISQRPKILPVSSGQRESDSPQKQEKVPPWKERRYRKMSLPSDNNLRSQEPQHTPQQLFVKVPDRFITQTSAPHARVNNNNYTKAIVQNSPWSQGKLIQDGDGYSTLPRRQEVRQKDSEFPRVKEIPQEKAGASFPQVSDPLLLKGQTIKAAPPAVQPPPLKTWSVTPPASSTCSSASGQELYSGFATLPRRPRVVKAGTAAMKATSTDTKAVTESVNGGAGKMSELPRDERPAEAAGEGAEEDGSQVKIPSIQERIRLLKTQTDTQDKPSTPKVQFHYDSGDDVGHT